MAERRCAKCGRAVERGERLIRSATCSGCLPPLSVHPRWTRPPGSSVSCAGCGRTVDPERNCFAVPTCFACLPPPPPIERAWLGAPNVIDLTFERHRRADRIKRSAGGRP